VYEEEELSTRVKRYTSRHLVKTQTISTKNANRASKQPPEGNKDRSVGSQKATSVKNTGGCRSHAQVEGSSDEKSNTSQRKDVENLPARPE